MTDKKCVECEKAIISDMADLQIEYDKLKKYYKLIIKCLDIKEELCKALREENEELRNKLEVYKNDR